MIEIFALRDFTKDYSELISFCSDDGNLEGIGKMTKKLGNFVVFFNGDSYRRRMQFGPKFYICEEFFLIVIPQKTVSGAELKIIWIGEKKIGCH